ncbi:MAG TPA: radical SAM protein [Candidatus Acidoferrales bacterium]|nr:radical SAM protein [Candidatus Acidoferrales bacterium]
MKVNRELDATEKTFSSGLLPMLIDAMRQSAPGDLLAVTGETSRLDRDIETWCRFTGNALVQRESDGRRTRWVIRCGRATQREAEYRPVGSRLWLYTNFDCNLRCDYCCVRSSPTAARRELGLARVQQIAREASPLGVREIFVTGGEPFLLEDIGEIVQACAEAAPTTVLTNGMLFTGRRLAALRSLPRERVTLQISLDSPAPERHDLHRGVGTWERAWQGIQIARAEGFRVRLAATVASDTEADEFRRFLDTNGIDERDRVIRRIALRGFADEGLALARADLIPEVTITADGVYWHPVGAEDADLLVRAQIFPLAESFVAVREAFEREQEHPRKLAAIFNCA